MARPHIPVAVLADRGIPLTLMGGLQVTLCYTFKSLMLLEERYGTLQAAMEILGAAQDGDQPASTGIDRKMFTGLAGIMSCGLTHEAAPAQPGVPGDGNPLSEPDVLADYLDVKELAAYAAAIGEAFSKSFPKPAAGETPDPPVSEETPSPGESGITSPSSTSGSPLASSGV